MNKRIALLTLFVVSAMLLIARMFMFVENPERAITACEAEGDRMQQCFAELVERIAEEQSVASAFDVLAAIYVRDRQFAEFCHGNTHELGRVAYALFSAGKPMELSDKTPYCGFGFYHGFIEALMEAEGDLLRARAFCAQVEQELSSIVSGVSFACYHGIGHGVIDGTDPSLWDDEDEYIAGGLALCDTLGEVEEHKERCASGVFNALAIAYRNQKYSLNADPNDPYRVCRKQDIRYAREACYDQMNTFVVETSNSFSEALALAMHSSEPAYRELAVMTVAGYQAQPALARGDDLGALVRTCTTLPTAFRDTCAHGFAVGLIEFGEPGEEYKAGLGACLAGGDAKDACLLGLVQGVRDRMPQARLPNVCREIGEKAGERFGALCSAGSGNVL